jgi:Holliday junction DNA helicase RuvA
VGPKAALALLGTLGPAWIARAVLEADANALTAAPGVGKRVAERIVLELKNKLPSLPAAEAPANPHAAEAVEALLLLGFREGAVRKAVARLAAAHPEASPEELIRLALKELR